MSLLSASQISELQNKKIIDWKQSGAKLEGDGFEAAILENHFNNFSLWHEEDKARRDDMGFEYVCLAKRKIDGFNQARNNAMEKIEEFILDEIKPDLSSCEFSSEAPGMMIDRLSILSLKKYHMGLQCERSDVDAKHLDTCKQKYAIICDQIADLEAALDRLLAGLHDGTRGFRVYRQCKMYNDPSLNPELYKNKKD